MLLIWSGRGFLAALIPLATCLLITLPLYGMTSTKHGWPITLGLLAGAAIVWYLGTRWNAAERVLIDPQTGQPVSLRRRHSLFFIPMQYWGYILGVFGLIFLTN